MNVEVQQMGAVVNLRVQGEVDEEGAEMLKQQFRRLAVSQLTAVNLDFSGVKHIGSAGIGKLLVFYKDLAIHGGKLTVANLSDELFQLFTEMKLNSVFSITKA